MLPRPKLAPEEARDTLKRIFPGIADDNVERLSGVLVQFSELPHGALLVISAGAAEEAVRLDRQCMKLELPVALRDEVIAAASHIDGAVLVDTAGLCHAISVILDGAPMGRVSAARGARFNSAALHIAARTAPAYAPGGSSRSHS